MAEKEEVIEGQEPTKKVHIEESSALSELKKVPHSFPPRPEITPLLDAGNPQSFH